MDRIIQKIVSPTVLYFLSASAFRTLEIVALAHPKVLPSFRLYSFEKAVRATRSRKCTAGKVSFRFMHTSHSKWKELLRAQVSVANKLHLRSYRHSDFHRCSLLMAKI